MTSPNKAEEQEYTYMNDYTTTVTPSDIEVDYLNVYSGYDNPPARNQYEGLDERTKEVYPNAQVQDTSEIVEMEETAPRIQTHRWCRIPPVWGWILIAIGIAVLVLLVVLLAIYSQKTCPAEAERTKHQSAVGACLMTRLTHTTANLPLSPDGVTVTVDCVTGATLPGGWTTYDTTCSNGTWSVTASCAFVDCLAAYNKGHRTSGVFRISPDGLQQMVVYCEQEGDLGGWTVIQRRQNGYVSFYQDWHTYKMGFGNVSGEYWLGNDNIHALTAGRGQRLKVEMRHPNTTLAQAEYSEFWIDDEARKYQLHASGFRNATPPGDALAYHNGHVFTTIDQDNDMHAIFNCARVHIGAWWYRDCMYSNLNGLYKGDGHQGIRWHPFTQHAESLTNVRMMVKAA